MTRVKICGITRTQDAELAIELGAAALGFNFYSPSPRYIAPEAAGEIIRRIPPPVMAVGIFADESDIERVLNVAGQAGVSAIQLHGVGAAFEAALTAKNAASVGRPQGPGVRYPVILAVTVNDSFEPANLRRIEANAILLDAPHPVLKGGTGRTIDWAKAREATRYARVLLAGGLTPENVGEAIRQVRPFAVDVASGVESAPGVKDASKLRAFFAAVRDVDKELEDVDPQRWTVKHS
ncbi:MAG TPA: phosphoribosylanthranilate isomerase [Terriglobia bacterium]|nr:phosphoribosylanthranilate isomerase [Terriglobia bacterium]